VGGKRSTGEPDKQNCDRGAQQSDHRPSKSTSAIRQRWVFTPCESCSVSSATSTAPAAIEAARGPLSPSPRHPGRPELRLRLGGRPFAPAVKFGALTPEKFWTLIGEVVKFASLGPAPLPGSGSAKTALSYRGFAFSPRSTRRRIASDRLGLSLCFTAQASTLFRSSGDSRMAVTGS
jgi:hypothetical protein